MRLRSQEGILTTQMNGWRSQHGESALVGITGTMGTRSSLMTPLESPPQNMLLSPLFKWAEAQDQDQDG